MKSTEKPIKLDRNKLFGFSQPSSGKAESENALVKPAIDAKAVGGKPVESPAASPIATRAVGAKVSGPIIGMRTVGGKPVGSLTSSPGVKQ